MFLSACGFDPEQTLELFAKETCLRKQMFPYLMFRKLILFSEPRWRFLNVSQRCLFSVSNDASCSFRNPDLFPAQIIWETLVSEEQFWPASKPTLSL